MAQVSYLPDKVAPPIDEPLRRAGERAALASRPIRIRLQPDLYNLDSQSYGSWLGLAWTLDLEDVEEGIRFRKGLEKFVAGFGDPEKQAQLLEMLEAL